MLLRALITAAMLLFGISSAAAQNSPTALNKKDENQIILITQADKEDAKKINPNDFSPKLSGPKEIVIRKDIDVKTQNSTLWDSFWKLPRKERMGILAIVGVTLLIIYGVSKHFLSRKKSH